MGRPKIPAALRIAVYRRAKWRCQYCGLKFRARFDGKAPMRSLGLWLELDHVVAFLLGGPDTFANLRAACSTCNRQRGIDAGDIWGMERVAAV